MRVITLVAVTLFALACATNPTPSIEVPTTSSPTQTNVANWMTMYRANGDRIGALVPATNTFQHPESPTVTAWLNGTEVGRTENSEKIVGVRFAGSHEHFGAMVKVIALALPEGVAATSYGSAEAEAVFRPIQVGTFMLNVGDRVIVQDLAKLGVAPMVVEYESALRPIHGN